MANDRKYFVKSGMRTNLDSFHDRLLCAQYDLCNNGVEYVEFLGKRWTASTIYDLVDEVENLIWVSGGRVTGKEYGRIKEISNDQNWHRYNCCIASGMDDDRASHAFM